MKKDFEKWHIIKKNTDNRERRPKIKVGDIYWCRLGLNIGYEQDGKNEDFARPVIVIKKYTSSIVFILPLTTKIDKTGDWYFDIEINNIKNKIILSQGRTIDVKRFENFILNLSENKTKEIIKAFIKLIDVNY